MIFLVSEGFRHVTNLLTLLFIYFFGKGERDLRLSITAVQQLKMSRLLVLSSFSCISFSLTMVLASTKCLSPAGKCMLGIPGLLW